MVGVLGESYQRRAQRYRVIQLMTEHYLYELFCFRRALMNTFFFVIVASNLALSLSTRGGDLDATDRRQDRCMNLVLRNSEMKDTFSR